MSAAAYLRSLKTGFGIEPNDRAELLRIADNIESLTCTVRRIYAEQLPDTWFVCGASTACDANGLPESIIVCPAYGSDVTKVYRRFDLASGTSGSAQDPQGLDPKGAGPAPRSGETPNA